MTFGAAYGVGAAVGPGESRAHAARDSAAHAAQAPGAKQPGHGTTGAAPAAGGLQVSERGYSLVLDTPRVAAGDRVPLRFSIRDAGGRKVTAYTRQHDREMHLIVASRDLSVYRHLHPSRAADGTWSTTADLPDAGGYRAFADFRPAGKGAEALTLGADLAVSGDYAPAPLPAPSRTAVVDGYEVTLTGGLTPGRSAGLLLNVARNGRPVTDLQPYLGAYGHLVVLRSGDLAHLHVHPNGGPGDGSTRPGPQVSFTATAPSTGTYRVFLDFQHDGKVRTAAFTVEAARPDEAGRTAPPPGGHAEQEAPGHAH
ncbi:hypothetical protein GCM10018773_45850 [Streptomyces candidus]|nr:hypothetical protein GCM10018773_45850 [Streptomyces candidus]